MPIAESILGGILTGGASLLGSLFSSGTSAYNQEKQNKFNAEQAEIDRQWRESMWNKENEYNTPTAQLQRIRDAGLSPGLMYQNGGSFAQASVPSGSQARAAESQRQFFDPGTAILQGLQAYQMMNQANLNKAQQKLTKEQEHKTSEEARNLSITNDILEATKPQQINIKMAEEESARWKASILHSQDYQEKVRSSQFDVELATAQKNLEYLQTEKELNIKETNARIKQIEETTIHQCNLMDAQAMYYAAESRLADINAAVAKIEGLTKATTFKATCLTALANMKSAFLHASNLAKQGKILDARKAYTEATTYAAKMGAYLTKKKADNYTTEQILNFAMPIYNTASKATGQIEFENDYKEDYGSQIPPPPMY